MSTLIPNPYSVPRIIRFIIEIHDTKFAESGETRIRETLNDVDYLTITRFETYIKVECMSTFHWALSYFAKLSCYSSTPFHILARSPGGGVFYYLVSQGEELKWHSNVTPTFWANIKGSRLTYFELESAKEKDLLGVWSFDEVKEDVVRSAGMFSAYCT